MPQLLWLWTLRQSFEGSHSSLVMLHTGLETSSSQVFSVGELFGKKDLSRHLTVTVQSSLLQTRNLVDEVSIISHE